MAEHCISVLLAVKKTPLAEPGMLKGSMNHSLSTKVTLAGEECQEHQVATSGSSSHAPLLAAALHMRTNTEPLPLYCLYKINCVMLCACG
jgi:hypothetical protein